MNEQHRDIRSFRRLRRRKDILERQIYDTDVVSRLGRSDPNSVGNVDIVWRMENQERQDEIDEIDYVLDYFGREEGVWTKRSHLVLLFLSMAVIVLAIMAVARIA